MVTPLNLCFLTVSIAHFGEKQKASGVGIGAEKCRFFAERSRFSQHFDWG